MNKSGFGINKEQVMKVLMHLDNIQKYKVVAGKQEWVIDIECINAAGKAIAPILIFKGEYMNIWWINEEISGGWYFITSKNGWISNDLDLYWLIKVFKLLIYESAAGQQQLLIADGHGSHIQADFIAYCMQNDINLFIMSSHCSHML